MTEAVQRNNVVINAIKGQSNPQIVVTAHLPYLTFLGSLSRMFLFSKIRIAAFACIPLFALYEIYMLMTSATAIRVASVLLWLLLMMVLPLLLMGILYLAWWRNKKAYGDTMIFRIDHWGVSATAQAYKTSMRWSSIKKVVETRHYLYFIISRQQVMILPIKDIPTASLPPLRTLAKQHPAYQLSSF